MPPEPSPIATWRRRSLTAVLLFVLALPAAAADDEFPTVDAALDAGVLAAEGRATLHHSPAALGQGADVFDGHPSTALVARDPGPAFIEVRLTTPVVVHAVEVFFPGPGDHLWEVLAGDTPDRLERVVADQRAPADGWSRVASFRRPVRARVFRIRARRLGGDERAAFGEVVLRMHQVPVALDLEAASGIVAAGGALPVRPRVRFDGGHRETDVTGLELWVDRGAPVRLEPWTGVPGGVRVRHERSGTAVVRGRIVGKRGALIEAAPLRLEVVDEGRPDWSVEWIEEERRRPVDDAAPRPGEFIVWRAQVRNVGTAETGRVTGRWVVDGEPLDDIFLDGLPRFGTTSVTTRVEHTGLRRALQFIVDPDDEHAELAEDNNMVVVATDSVRLGVWVERPVVERFRRAYEAAGRHGGFADWVQRLLDAWNTRLYEARSPALPGGLRERWRLDRVVTVAEDALPVFGGHPVALPDARERTVHLVRGFPARDLADGALDPFPTGDCATPFEAALLHDWLAQRGLADLAALDVRTSEVTLTRRDGRPVAGTAQLPATDGLVHRGSVRDASTGDPARPLAAHTAAALDRIAPRPPADPRRADPGHGAYLATLPRSCGIVVTDGQGTPLVGVRVAVWRRSVREDGTIGFHGSPFREGITRTGGHVDLSFAGSDPWFDGRRSGLDPAHGVVLLRFERDGRTAWRFLEVVPYNLAAWGGARTQHLETLAVEDWR